MLITIRNGILSLNQSDHIFFFEGSKFWFKGYFFIGDDYYKGVDACKYINENLFSESIKQPLNLNGIYQCIIINEQKKDIYILNDRFGFQQLFYFASNDLLVLSDDFWEVAKRASVTDVDQVSLLEFMKYRFVSGKYTLAKNVFCIEPATINHINYAGKSISLSKEIYWRFRYAPEIKSKAEAEKKLYNCLNGIILRYKRTLLENKNIGINLTGGFDSRFILSLLLQNGIPLNKITAFTFGSSTCDDVKIASEISSVLDITHHFENFDHGFDDFFDKSNIDSILKDIGFFNYYLQGYGFKKLSDRYTGIDYLMSGCDGFILSIYASQELFEVSDYQEAVDYIYKINANMLSEKECEKLFLGDYLSTKQKLFNRIINEEIDKSLDPVSIYYDWTFKNRNRKYLLSYYEVQNRNTTHLLQFYDYEFVNLMSQIPPSMIIGQQQYINTMYKNAFTGELQKLREIKIGNRGVLLKRGDDYLIKGKPKITTRKIKDKIINPPDDAFPYPIQRTIRNKNEIFDYIIKELINNKSKYLNTDKCVKLINKMKRSNRFTRYGLVVIISILRFEEMIRNNHSSD